MDMLRFVVNTLSIFEVKRYYTLSIGAIDFLYAEAYAFVIQIHHDDMQENNRRRSRFFALQVHHIYFY